MYHWTVCIIIWYHCMSVSLYLSVYQCMSMTVSLYVSLNMIEYDCIIVSLSLLFFLSFSLFSLFFSLFSLFPFLTLPSQVYNRGTMPVKDRDITLVTIYSPQAPLMHQFVLAASAQRQQELRVLDDIRNTQKRKTSGSILPTLLVEQSAAIRTASKVKK